MKESDIRQIDVLNEYLGLIKKDIELFFKPDDFIHINCPGCGSEDYSLEFNKNGFSYCSCSNCKTVFANPRPSRDKLDSFYFSFRITTFYRSL